MKSAAKFFLFCCQGNLQTRMVSIRRRKHLRLSPGTYTFTINIGMFQGK